MIQGTQKICKVCQKTYSYCPNCAEDRYKPFWYMVACCDNCHQIFDILCAFETGNLAPTKAKQALEKLDLSGVDDFHPLIQNQISIIINKSEKEQKEAAQKTSQPEGFRAVSDEEAKETKETATDEKK